jgi:hypothetical protein
VNRSFSFTRRFTSAKPLAQLANELIASLQAVGGTHYASPDGVRIVNGNMGVDFNFLAEVDADVRIVMAAPGTYDVIVMISTRPAPMFWVGVVGGFFTGLLWILPVLYFVMDPQKPYMAAIDRVAYVATS